MWSQPSNGTSKSWRGSACLVWMDHSSSWNMFFGLFRLIPSLYSSLHTRPIMLEEVFTALYTFWAFLNHHNSLEAYLLLQVFSYLYHEILILLGYVFFGLIFLGFHLISSKMNMEKLSNLAKICYMCIKVGILLVVCMVIMPIICGWWIDICSLSMLNATVSDRIGIFFTSLFNLTEYCSFLSSISWSILWFPLAVWSALHILLRNVLDLHERGPSSWTSLVPAEFERPRF